MAAVEALPTVTPCELCASFRGGDGYCAVYRMPVPKEAQPEGCASWIEDVPF